MAITKSGTPIPIRRPGASQSGDGKPTDEGRSSGYRQQASGPDKGRREVQPAERRGSESTRPPETTPEVDWRDVALRLKADMENFRKRQKRWAEDEVTQEKARLLRKFLEAVDNLEKALDHIDEEDPAHQGVQLAYDSLLAMLIREGVDRVFAKGQVFNPELHEAVAVVPAPWNQQEDLRVVEVISPGYRYAGRILRPAKVVVAKREGVPTLEP